MTVTLLAHSNQFLSPLGLPPKNYFLHIGRHDSHKNIVRLVESFAKVASHQDDELWLVGSQGKYSSAIRRMADELAISKKIKLMNYVPENQFNDGRRHAHGRYRFSATSTASSGKIGAIAAIHLGKNGLSNG